MADAYEKYGDDAWLCETCDTYTAPGQMVCDDCRAKPMPPATKRQVNRQQDK